MSLLNKCFSLVLCTGVIGSFLSSAYGIPSSTSDELYSESIYIQKSSAEIPGSLESSGTYASADVSKASTQDTESAAAVDSPAPKKSRQAVKKSKKH